MTITDIMLTLLILFVFLIIIMYSTISEYIATADKSWAANRCNPLVMPFVGLVGHDAAKNFMRCVKSADSKNINNILDPVKVDIDTLNNRLKSLNNIVDNTRTDLFAMRDNTSDVFEKIYNVIFNLLSETQRSLIWIKDVISKMVGVLTALSYSMQGNSIIDKSILTGPAEKIKQSIRYGPMTILERQKLEKKRRDLRLDEQRRQEQERQLMLRRRQENQLWIEKQRRSQLRRQQREQEAETYRQKQNQIRLNQQAALGKKQSSFGKIRKAFGKKKKKKKKNR